MKPEKNSKDPLTSNLEAFQSIDVESDWKELRSGIEFSKEMATGNRPLARIWWAAASIILLLGVAFLSKEYLFSPHEMIIARAGDALEEVLLPDGSLVTLNNMTELTYPEKFRKGKREVLLSGEAFFKVERNPQKPFMVRIEEKAVVKVLGTSFTIRSEQSGETVSVLVVEGRVEFTDAEEKLSAMILNGDEQATLSRGILQREEAINKNMLSWRTGILYFDQSFIGDVVKQLEMYYDREILLGEGIPDNLQFTSTVDNQDIESILEELSMVLGLAINFEDDLILISKSP